MLQLTSCRNITDATVSALAQNCTALKGIDLRNCDQLTDEPLEQLVTRCRNIASIDISGCFEVGNAPVKALGNHCRSLTHMDLGGLHRVTDTSLRVVTRNCSNLKWIGLRGCKASDVTLSLIARCSSLVHLNFRGCRDFTDFALAPVAEGTGSLTFLDLGGCDRLTSKSVAVFTGKNPNLTHVDLRACRLVLDSTVRLVARACVGLRYLNLTKGPSVSDMTLEDLGGNCSELRDLRLRGSSVEDGALMAIAQGCPNVTHLDLTGSSNITDDGIVSLADGLGLSLTKLLLRKCGQIGNVGVQALADRCHHLEFLDLSWLIDVNDKPLVALVRGCRQLKHLDLSWCRRLTNKIIRIIATEAPRIQVLDIGECPKIDLKALKQLEARPGMRVTRSSKFEQVKLDSHEPALGVRGWCDKTSLGYAAFIPGPKPMEEETWERFAKAGRLHEPRPFRAYSYTQDHAYVYVTATLPKGTRKRQAHVSLRQQEIHITARSATVVKGDLFQIIDVTSSSWAFVRSQEGPQVNINLRKSIKSKKPWRSLLRTDFDEEGL